MRSCIEKSTHLQRGWQIIEQQQTNKSKTEFLQCGDQWWRADIEKNK